MERLEFGRNVLDLVFPGVILQVPIIEKIN